MGFKRVLVDKVNIYSKIVELMMDNGWQNISSVPTPEVNVDLKTSAPGVTPVTSTPHATTTAAAITTYQYDWDILRSLSTGATVQMIPWTPSAETNAATIIPNNDVRKSARMTIGVRMLKGYTPGETVDPVLDTDGVTVVTPGYNKRGVITNNPPWASIHLFGTDNATPATQDCAATVTNIELLYFIDPDRAMFVLRFPQTMAKKCTFFYIGVPPSIRGERIGINECIIAQTFMPGLTGNRILSIDYPVGVGDVAVNTYLSNASQLQLPLKNPSYLKEYWLAPIYYGLDTIGMRGKLDGMFALGAGIGLVDRDQIMVGIKTYEVCELAVNTTYCSFNAAWVAIEMDDDSI